MRPEAEEERKSRVLQLCYSHSFPGENTAATHGHSRKALNLKWVRGGTLMWIGTFMVSKRSNGQGRPSRFRIGQLCLRVEPLWSHVHRDCEGCSLELCRVSKSLRWAKIFPEIASDHSVNVKAPISKKNTSMNNTTQEGLFSYVNVICSWFSEKSWVTNSEEYL